MPRFEMDNNKQASESLDPSKSALTSKWSDFLKHPTLRVISTGRIGNVRHAAIIPQESDYDFHQT
jgi:hypothetical protein